MSIFPSRDQFLSLENTCHSFLMLHCRWMPLECKSMLMQSASLIVTPLWTSVCKPMNWIEVSRIAGFHTDIYMLKFSGGGGWEDPPPPCSIQLRQIKYYLHNAKSLYCIYNKKTCIIPWHFYTCTYCLILRLWTIFFFGFLGKICAPPHTFHHWATPLISLLGLLPELAAQWCY